MSPSSRRGSPTVYHNMNLGALEPYPTVELHHPTMLRSLLSFAAVAGAFVPTARAPIVRAPRVDATTAPAEARVMTLTRFMIDVSRKEPGLQDLESLMASIQMACKTIASLVQRAGINNLSGLEAGGGSINVQGEEQKKLVRSRRVGARSPFVTPARRMSFRMTY